MRFGIAGNLEKEGLADIVQRLVERCRKENVEFAIEESLARKIRRQVRLKDLRISQVVPEKKLATSCDLLISLGGDGTILRMARSVAKKGTPILGVNLGKLGFLAEVSLEDLDTCITEILSGNYVVEERMMLEAVVDSSTKSYIALNDVVVDKYGTSRVVDFETYVNDDYLATFTADGVILSTPTGSTAYALANGGPIVIPANRSITISPICPHTLTARPVIVPDDSTITVKATHAPGRVHLSADGQDEVLLNVPTEIKIKKAPYTAHLVKRRNTSYFDVLRKKLQWGRDVRIQGHR